MPTINFMDSTAMPLASLLSSMKTSESGNSWGVSSTALPTSTLALSSIDSDASSTWTAPKIIGATFAVLAFLVGVPSALLAIRKLLKSRQAQTSNTKVVDAPLGDGNTGSNVANSSQGASIGPNRSPSSESSVPPAQTLDDNLGEYRGSDLPDTQIPPSRDDSYELSDMSGLESSASSSQGLMTAKMLGM